MKTEEELLKIERDQLKRARTNATVFGILATVALIAFIYAFFQQAAAKKAKIEATHAVEECQKITAEAEARADVANKKVEQLMIEVQIAKEVAESANNSNKKK